MKKANSVAKGCAVPSNVDEYLAAVPEPARTTLSRIREVIRSVVPAATETISYQIPTFKYRGRSIIAFAAFTNHCSLFPMSGAVIEKFKSDLQHFHTSKGTLQFPLDKPLPASLVRKLVKARIAENDQKYPG